jgi:hypothetical protein
MEAKTWQMDGCLNFETTPPYVSIPLRNARTPVEFHKHMACLMKNLAALGYVMRMDPLPFAISRLEKGTKQQMCYVKNVKSPAPQYFQMSEPSEVLLVPSKKGKSPPPMSLIFTKHEILDFVVCDPKDPEMCEFLVIHEIL